MLNLTLLPVICSDDSPDHGNTAIEMNFDDKFLNFDYFFDSVPNNGLDSTLPRNWRYVTPSQRQNVLAATFNYESDI